MSNGISKSTPARIAAEDLDNISGWNLPSLESGRILSTAEKEAAERRAKAARSRGEIIEDIDNEVTNGAPITAQQLQEIAESAEREGFEQGRKAGFEVGHKEGAEAGRQQALEEMRQQLSDAVAQLNMLANTLLHPLEDQENQLEFLLLSMVKKLTQSLVRRELQTDSSHILSIVRTALAALPVGSENITLYLNPDDLAMVENYADEQQKDWTFVGDAELMPGGCRIETRESLVDFSVESQLEKLMQEFDAKQLAGDENTALAEAAQQARLAEQTDTEGSPVAGQVSSELTQTPERGANPAVDDDE